MRIENMHAPEQEKHHVQVYALDFYLCMCTHARAQHYNIQTNDVSAYWSTVR